MSKSKILTKTLLVISVFCMGVGTILGIVGFSKGISSWIGIEDGWRFVSSNGVEPYVGDNEVEPFSSVVVNFPTAELKIISGDKYSIKYSSKIPNFMPVISVNNGVLSIINSEDADNIAGVMNFYPNEDKDNFIYITVPADVKIDEIKLSDIFYKQINYENMIEITEVKIGSLAIGDYLAQSQFAINDCIIDNMTINSRGYCDINNSTIGNLSFSDYNNISEGSSKLTIFGSTINTFDSRVKALKNETIETVDTERHFSYSHVEIRITDSTLGATYAECYGFNMQGSTAQSLNVKSLRAVTISDYLVKDNDKIMAVNQVDVSVEQKKGEVDYSLARRIFTDKDIVSTVVQYGNDDYSHGYPTPETIALGTQWVAITEQDYYEFQNSLNNSTYQNGNDVRGKYNIVRPEYEYDESNQQSKTIYKGEVYNSLLVTYYIDDDGQKVFIELNHDDFQNSSQAGEGFSIRVNGVAYNEFVVNAQAQGQPKFNCFSRNGSIYLTHRV